MEDQITDEEFLAVIVTSIVKNPKDVKIERIKDDIGVLLTLHVKKEDMGLVIGKQGVHAQAIKLFVKLFGLNHNEKTTLKIAEPD